MSVVRRYGVLLIILLVIGGLAFIFRDRISGSAAELQVGDCFDEPTALVEIKDVQHHPCTEAHTGEVFAVLKHPAPDGAPVPSTDAMRDYFGTTCLSLANAYIGGDILAQDVLDCGGFYPTDAGWTKGDRSITCYLTRVDHQPMTTSMKAGPKPS